MGMKIGLNGEIAGPAEIDWPRSVTMRSGAVHILLPDDCPCGPEIREPAPDEQDWRLVKDVPHHVRVHPANGEDGKLMEIVD